MAMDPKVRSLADGCWVITGFYRNGMSHTIFPPLPANESSDDMELTDQKTFIFLPQASTVRLPVASVRKAVDKATTVAGRPASTATRTLGPAVSATAASGPFWHLC